MSKLTKPNTKGVNHKGEKLYDYLEGVDQNILNLNNVTRRVLNVEELRSYTPRHAGEVVYLLSSYSISQTEYHVGGGYFMAVEGGKSVYDDGGINVHPYASDMSWKRFNFTEYDMQFWGVKADGKTDNADAISRATWFAKQNRVILTAPLGNIHTSQAIPIYDNMGIRGQGKAESTVFYKTTNNKFQLKNNGVTSLEVDAMVVFVPENWDLLDHNMTSFCSRGILERCMLRRLGLTQSNVAQTRPYYGIFLGKAASPYIREVQVEGAYIGIKAHVAFSGIMESVGVSQWNRYGYAGVDFSNYHQGTHYMTGTSMDMRLVQVRGFQFGFSITRLQYSTMLDCTAEEIQPLQGETTSAAFQFIDPYSISMVNCATEFITGAQIFVSGASNPSFASALKVTGYLPIDQQNPVTPTPMFSVDSTTGNEMNVVFDAGNLTRKQSYNNLLAPKVIGANAKVIIIGCSGEDWTEQSGGKFTRLA